MKIIVGLGNPGKDFEGTRHNAGFMFAETLASDKKISTDDEPVIFGINKRLEAQIAQKSLNGEKLIIVKPQTFMNASGKAVSKILSYYKATPEDLIVVSDDKDLPVGTIRIRHEGASGGHNGLQDVIDALGTNQFIRVRIGILETQEEALQTEETANYVLSTIGKRALPIVKNSITQAVSYILEYLETDKVIPAHTFEVESK